MDYSQIKTVIFDMDGTLIDTEKYFRQMWPKALAHFGYHMTDEQSLSMRSLGRPFVISHLQEMFGSQFDYDQVHAYRKRLMEEVLAQNGIEKKPGVVELLTFLKEKDYQIAVATATDLERTKRYLTDIGLLPYFDDLICATMVPQGKPAPDIYRYACDCLGKKPEECIAVEDSPNGVRSAYQAGCHVIMVLDQTQPDAELTKYITDCVGRLDDIITLLDGR